jgi:hypothetical protein
VGWVTVSEQLSIPVAVEQVWAAIADPAWLPAIDPRFALVSTDSSPAAITRLPPVAPRRGHPKAATGHLAVSVGMRMRLHLCPPITAVTHADRIRPGRDDVGRRDPKGRASERFGLVGLVGAGTAGWCGRRRPDRPGSGLGPRLLTTPAGGRRPVGRGWQWTGSVMSTVIMGPSGSGRSNWPGWSGRSGRPVGATVGDAWRARRSDAPRTAVGRRGGPSRPAGPNDAVTLVRAAHRRARAGMPRRAPQIASGSLDAGVAWLPRPGSGRMGWWRA